MKCKQCNKIFIPFRPGHIFCSKHCREKHWRLNNKEKTKMFCRKWNLKKPIFCHWCNNIISTERRNCGVKFCSEKCRVEKKRFNSKKYWAKTVKAFSEFKISKGCTRCGYNKCAASLDFHHVGEKDRRITARMWYYNSLMIQEELRKCILLCKNCHYEVHNGFPLSFDEEQKIFDNGYISELDQFNGDIKC